MLVVAVGVNSVVRSLAAIGSAATAVTGRADRSRDASGAFRKGCQSVWSFTSLFAALPSWHSMIRRSSPLRFQSVDTTRVQSPHYGPRDRL